MATFSSLASRLPTRQIKRVNATTKKKETQKIISVHTRLIGIDISCRFCWLNPRWVALGFSFLDLILGLTLAYTTKNIRFFQLRSITTSQCKEKDPIPIPFSGFSYPKKRSEKRGIRDHGRGGREGGVPLEMRRFRACFVPRRYQRTGSGNLKARKVSIWINGSDSKT